MKRIMENETSMFVGGCADGKTYVSGGCPACGHGVARSRFVWRRSYSRWCARDDKSPSAGDGQAEFRRETEIGNMIPCLKLGTRE